MKREEDQIQRAICRHLALRGKPGLVWFAVPNGGKRNRITGAILKSLGVKAGVADLILLHNSHAYALELKSEKGHATDAQLEFVSKFSAAGGTAGIAHGLDRALRYLELWGVINVDR